MEKKIIRLTESELRNIIEASVRRAVKETAVNEGWKGTLAGGALGAAALTAGIGAGAFDDQMDDIDRNSRAFPEDRVEYGDRLKPQSELPADTISWEKANQFEGRINRAIAESINKILSEEINELDPRTYASARDKQNAIDAEYDKQMADYNKKNPLSRMMSKKPEMPRGYGRSQKFNDAAVDAFNRDYGHDWSNPNSTKHQTMGKSGNVTQYSQLGDSTFTTDYDFDARQAKAGVEPTGRGRGVVTSGGWNNKTHQNFAPTKRGMTYSDADYTLRSGANKPNFFDKGVRVADQMANGYGKYQNGKWQ